MINILSNSDLPHVNPDKSKIKSKTINYQKLQALAQNKNWNEILNHSDPNMALSRLVKNITETVQQSSYEIKINNKFKKLKPWISQGIITSIRARDKLKQNLKLNPTAEKIAEYKNYRNYLNKIITQTKNDYYKSKINENSHNIKKVYNFINEALNYEKNTEKMK